ncbi:MAG: AmmeMemoRadiSam system radical SAM enzyme [Candidatus Omnitrophica bacterium]|nr:AmmeMemoRadiSam system radical SAM enzyme [Candidatus Omnitrophota bacterium]
MPKNISRRDFLKTLLRCGVLLYSTPLLGNIFGIKNAYGKIGETRGLKEALFYRKIDDRTVQCLLCPRKCTLQEGARSFCRVRENVGGKLNTLVYELPCAVHVDPIEKKPIYHMLPGTLAFSIATAGCNLRCKFCQNWQISQMTPEETDNVKLSCSAVISNAKKEKCLSIAYTYSEPTVFYEYMIETAALAKKEGIKNIFKTGGFINPEPLSDLCNYLDAANVDLKGFDKKYLEDVCAEDLDVVLNGLRIYKKKGVWLEITNLIVPTLNDDMKTIKNMSIWIKDNLGPETPLHFSRFWPTYKLKNLYPTPLETLTEARDTAISTGLKFVYIGNIPDHPANNTYCPSCQRLLIERKGYFLAQNNIINSLCKYCSAKIAGVWEMPKTQIKPLLSRSAISTPIG